MAYSTSRVCVPREDNRLCPAKRIVCPAGCKAGFCLNSQCLYATRPEIVYCRPDIDIEADIHRKRIQDTVKIQKNIERAAFLASERRQMGMTELEGDGVGKGNDDTSIFSDGRIDVSRLQAKERRKYMRPHARPSCMLDVPNVCHSSDDYSQMSLFTRTSTMPGYSRNDTISTTSDTHNMSVWNNRKEIDRQIYKLKRDWLSIWGEMNFRDQRCRKAWLDKLAESTGKR